MRRTTAGIVIAALAAVAGCAVPIAGTPTASRSVGSSSPTSASSPDAQQEDLRWTTVTDGATGTTAVLPAPANPEQRQLPNADPALPVVSATLYQAATARSGTVQLIIIQRAPNGVFNQEREVRVDVDELKGTVTEKRPVTVDGHAGIDYTITYTAQMSGKPSVVHTRFVEAKAFAVRLTTRGVDKDPATIAAVHERAAASLKVPAP
jgi:hypothetical protein